MKKRKNKKKIIIILIIFCIMLLVAIPIILKKYNRHKLINVGSYRKVKTIEDPKKDGILNLSGFGVFFEKFTGELKSSEVAYKLEEIATKKIPRTYEYIKDYNDQELSTFYENNQKSIYNMYGIDNLDDFVKFANELQKVKKDNINDCYRLDLNVDTFLDESDKDGYASVEFKMSYINDSEINFIVYVAKSSNITPQYIIKVK